MCVVLASAALAGCEAPVRIRPGLSAVRFSVRARAKEGYRFPTAAPGEEDPYPRPMDRERFEAALERIVGERRKVLRRLAE